MEVIANKDMSIYGSDNERIYLKTHNKALLWSDDAPWGKTGYTIEARRTFVGIDPSHEPRIIIAVLQSRDLWDDITTLNDKGLELYDRKYKKHTFNLVSWLKSKFAKDKS